MIFLLCHSQQQEGVSEFTKLLFLVKEVLASQVVFNLFIFVNTSVLFLNGFSNFTAVTLQFVSHSFLNDHDPTIGEFVLKINEIFCQQLL